MSRIQRYVAGTSSLAMYFRPQWSSRFEARATGSSQQLVSPFVLLYLDFAGTPSRFGKVANTEGVHSEVVAKLDASVDPRFSGAETSSPLLP